MTGVASEVDAAAAVSTRRATTRPLVITDGSLEVLKWLALLCMVADHINKYLLAGQQHVFFVFGRLALPLFAFVLGYNLARTGIDHYWQRRRLMRRLAVFAVISTIPYMLLGGLVNGWWPLNFMFALFVAVAVIELMQQPSRGASALALLLFLAGGFLVEYWWPGIAAVVTAWLYARRPTLGRLVLWTVTLALLLVPVWFLTGGRFALNVWALGAVPVIWGATRVDLDLPRVRWLFYAAFPAQFAAIWLIRVALG